jgi:uncharacterized protein YggE
MSNQTARRPLQVHLFGTRKRVFAIGLVVLIGLVSFLYFVAIPRINVTGTGTVTAYPNEADLQFAVQTQNQSAVQAAAENAAIMTRVFTSLTSIGVDVSDIKTTSYSLSPTYDSVNYTKVVGYVAVNSVEVIVAGAENLSRVGKMIDAVIQAGVNQIDGITFTFNDTDYNTLQAQAYQKAVQDASSQASAIVSGLGGVIIGVAAVSTNYGYGILPQPLIYNGAKSSTPITSGTQQVTATVNITYLYV